MEKKQQVAPGSRASSPTSGIPRDARVEASRLQTRRPRRPAAIRWACPVPLLALAWFLSVLQVRAGDVPQKYSVPAQPLATAPMIDGRLDDPVWTKATALSDFTQYEPIEGAPASEKTVVTLGYNENTFFLGIRCFDSQPERRVEKQMQRDGDLTFDDFVEIIIDTYHDRRNGFLFSVNALGAKLDGMVRNEGEEIKTEWDGEWECVTTRDDQGWNAEMAIPLSTLRFPTKEPQAWGINIMRYLPRNNEKLFWKPLTRADGYNYRYRISAYGEITGLQNLKSGRRFLVSPYVTGVAANESHLPSEPAFNGGIDLKANLASNLVADFTYRLDFAEAEADLRQINLSRYPLYLPEKREFFTESSDMFYFGDRPEPFELAQREKFNFFFSRNIGLTPDGRHKIPVIGGAKVTGKLGGTTIGFLNLTTDAAAIPPIGGEDAYDVPRTNYAVLRMRHDVYSKSKVGLIVLNKDASGDEYNRGFGVDGDFALGKNFTVSGFLAATSTPDLRGEDRAWAVDTVWDSKLFRFRNMYTEVGENFNPEMGFLTRPDIKKFHSNLLMTRRPQFWGLRKINIVYDFNYVTDTEGRLLTQTSIYELGFIHNKGTAGVAFLFYDHLEVLPTDWTKTLDASYSVVIPRGSYRYRNFFIGAATDRRQPLSATVWFDKGGYYNGTRFQFLVQPIYRPREGVDTSMILDRQEFHFPDGDHTTLQISGSVGLTLPHDTWVKTLLQWTRGDNFGANVIFNWAFLPDASLYLIYDGTRDVYAGTADVPEQIVNDRSFVAKVAYNLSH
ncbi:MAG: DUF5916 domain-containing protein [Acidobacteriota bacterium]